MKLGFALPQAAPPASAEMITQIAQRTEALGYHSLWVGERLIWPIQPQTPYPGSPDGRLPAAHQNLLDAIDVLVYAAAATRTIRLGTSVLVAPYHNPIVLGRRLASLDVLSNGRLSIGLGIGWSKDEYDASGVPFAQRGARMEELLQLLHRMWTEDTIEFHGRFYQVPAAKIGPKPIQKPRPPLYLAAFAEKAVDRLIRMADGWNPAGIATVETLAGMIQYLKTKAKEAGRDPNKIEVVLRSFPLINQQPSAPGARGLLNGTIAEIASDVQRLAAVGVTEVFYDLNFSLSQPSDKSRLLEAMEQLRQTA